MLPITILAKFTHKELNLLQINTSFCSQRILFSYFLAYHPLHWFTIAPLPTSKKCIWPSAVKLISFAPNKDS